MLIYSVRLENFKSYELATIHFELGTNAIVGQNGAGKSTILEAIGFAMFAHAGTARQSDLLREGATSGSVTVAFCSSLDERHYEVERLLGRTGTTRHRIYDPDAGRMVLAESVNEVTRWLREHLGVDQESSLEDLFRNTIGVPQGTFTAPFLMTAGERKRLFDPLLQVDEYDRAYARLRETARYLADERHAANEEIAHLRGLLEQLPRLTEEAVALEANIERLEATTSELEAALSAIRRDLERLDVAEREVRRLEQHRAEASAQHGSAERALQAAQASVLEAVAAAERLASAEPGYRAFLAAEQRRHKLEQDRLARDKTTRALDQLRVSESRVQTRLEQVQQALDAIDEAQRELTTLQPRVAQQEELQHALEEARTEARLVQETKRHAAGLSKELESQQAQLASLEAALARVPEMEASLAELEQTLTAVETTERALMDERSALQAQTGRLREQSETLEKEHGATCPVCEGELTPKHRQELLGRNQEQMGAYVTRLNAVATELRALTGQRDQLRRDRAAMERLLRDQPSSAQRDQLAATIRDGQERYDAMESRIEQSEQRALRVPEITAQLQALGDPATRSRMLTSLVAEEGRRNTEQTALKAQQSDIATQSATLLDQLVQYDRLDQALREVTEALAASRSDHDMYLTSRDVAGQLERRQQERAEQERQLEELTARLEQLTTEHSRASEGYDAALHQEVRQKVEQTSVQAERERTLLASSRDRLSAVVRQRQELEQAQEHLGERQCQAERLVALGNTLEEMRTLLRSAGPYVTRQLVANISTQASGYYADIMNDYSGRLTWSEDYELSLEVKGHKRSFQQLSGGEQMSAALALRLALLRQLTNINVAFFDEPTAHLDPERRDGLAEKIMQVKGFDQLFVISHDDTFERAAQNYIRIIKQDGVSLVAES